MSRYISVLIIFILPLFLQTCVPKAEHDNPLDPYLAKSVNGVKFSGTVFTKYQPYQPLGNVKVSVEDIGRFVYTNSAGQYEI